MAPTPTRAIRRAALSLLRSLPTRGDRAAAEGS